MLKSLSGKDTSTFVNQSLLVARFSHPELYQRPVFERTLPLPMNNWMTLSTVISPPFVWTQPLKERATPQPYHWAQRQHDDKQRITEAIQVEDVIYRYRRRGRRSQSGRRTLLPLIFLTVYVVLLLLRMFSGPLRLLNMPRTH